MSRIPRNEAIACLLRDIEEQATRHKRAASQKPYLITDLEIIEKTIEDLRRAIASDEPEIQYPALAESRTWSR